jgi:hypothetical protein
MCENPLFAIALYYLVDVSVLGELLKIQRHR